MCFGSSSPSADCAAGYTISTRIAGIYHLSLDLEIGLVAYTAHTTIWLPTADFDDRRRAAIDIYTPITFGITLVAIELRLSRK